MRPVERFRNRPGSFWATVRTLSETVGSGDSIVVPSPGDVAAAFQRLNLKPGEASEDVLDYLWQRARLLTEEAAPNLMTASEARHLFEEVRGTFQPTCPIPLNKQRGEKRVVACLTAFVNMTIERTIGDLPCDFDPRRLTRITRRGKPLRTFSRRADGAFPSGVDPIAIWEIKEHYFTTTFGSRVSGGVFETLLDGMEIDELRRNEGVRVRHYFMVDGYETWWKQGKPHLCRLCDALHMGYVDEVLVGRRVVAEIPRLAGEWADEYRTRGSGQAACVNSRRSETTSPSSD